MADTTVETRTDPGRTRVRRAATAAFLGSMLEYYEFSIYASAAALVFGRAFFPADDPAIGTLLALATFSVAYVTRPIGAVVLGHLGDRIGRKRILLVTLALMGTATFLVGCLPGYSSIGVWAPVLLVVLRFFQGISTSGEQAGANTLTLEHAPEGRRAFFTSWTLTGTQGGFILATIVFLAVETLPQPELLAWGWRIPFWASALVVVATYLARRRLEEPDVFTDNRARGAIERFPVATLLRTRSAALVRVVLCSLMGVCATVFSVFGLAFATSKEIGVPSTTMLLTAVIANVVALAMQPTFGHLADRIGRKPVFAGGLVGCAASVFLYFWAITTGRPALIVVCAILLIGICYSAPIGAFAAFFAEMFPSTVRFSGMAVGTQVGFAVAGIAPTLAWTIIGTSRTNWVPVAVLVAAACAIAAAAALTAPETARTPLDQLGR